MDNTIVTHFMHLNAEWSFYGSLVIFRQKLVILADLKFPYIYTEQKKLRKSQKIMQHKNTKANNYSIVIYLFRYRSSVEKNVYFSLLAPILFCGTVSSSPGVKVIFRKNDYRVFPHKHMENM